MGVNRDNVAQIHSCNKYPGARCIGVFGVCVGGASPVCSASLSGEQKSLAALGAFVLDCDYVRALVLCFLSHAVLGRLSAAGISGVSRV